MQFDLEKFLFDPTIGKVAAIMMGVSIIWASSKSYSAHYFQKLKITKIVIALKNLVHSLVIC